MSPDQTVVLGGTSDLGGLADEWMALAESVGASYFQTPDWVLAWWDLLAGRPPTRLMTWRGRDGSLEAIAFVSRVRERLHPRAPISVPLWVISGTGPGAADHCGWPMRPHRAADVAEWLRGWTGGSLRLANLEVSGARAILPPEAVRIESTPCPRVPIPTHMDDLGRSRNFRAKLRSSRRQLADRGVAFRLVGPGDEARSGPLGDLLAFHRARSRDRGWASSFDEDRAAFHRGLLERSRPGRGAAFVVGEHAGRPIAVLYGFLFGGVFAYYQSGWDRDWSDTSLGTLLLAESIRLAGTAGASVFDFLRGAEPYKYRFGAEDVADETWLLPHGAAGALLRAKHRVAAARGRADAPAPERGSSGGPDLSASRASGSAR